MDIKLLIIHAKARSYRRPLFDALHKRYPTIFLFTQDSNKDEPIPSDWQHKYFNNIKLPGYSGDVAPGIIIEMIKQRSAYNTVIASDIASFSTHVSFLMAKLLNKKFIVFNELWKIPNNLRGKLLKIAIKVICRYSNAIIVAGTKSRDYLSSYTNKNNIFIAPNYGNNYSKIHFDDAKLNELKNSLNPDNKISLLYLGRIIPIKNLDSLISAFSKIENKIDNIQLIIVGSGIDKQKCKQFASQLKINNIKFIDKVSEDKVPYLYKISDLFILPGKFDLSSNVSCESWGLTINEAMSVGLPIISTTSVGGAYDLIKEGVNGYQVEAENSTSLANAILKIINNPTALNTMGKESYKLVINQFCIKCQLEGFINAIKSIR